MPSSATSKRSVLTVTNPYDQSVVAEIPYDRHEQIARKLEAAALAWEQWRANSLEDRIRIVTAGLMQLREAGEDIARDVTRQMGKPLSQARGELATMFDRADRSIADAPMALGADCLPKSGFVRRIEHEPLGVVLDIAAWNYPLLIPINVIVPALLAGNVVLLKHSAKTPLTGQAFADAFAELEVPNLLTNLTLTHQQTADLIGHPRIDHVAFTGSVEGGRQIYQAVAQSRLIDVGLELGGKDPAYVAADADLEFAAANIVDGACYNAGQSCCAVERVYIHHDLYEPFLEKAATLIAAYQLGNPLEEATTMGPLASREAPAFLQQQVEDATDRGARLLVGGQVPKNLPGNFYAPTLLADVENSAAVMQHESFGPLLPVAAVRDDEEALKRMNDSAFGLTASIWTRDRERAEHLAKRTNAGTIFQNRCDYIDPALPWTGWGESGKGSTMSRFG
ncbi:MAG: aldehyde dehydrogenase family protein, partial [Planctomycetes bacterium]|nr:aldehyde dehydrogenase family protein [Planctomycetota bacterium]